MLCSRLLLDDNALAGTLPLTLSTLTNLQYVACTRPRATMLPSVVEGNPQPLLVCCLSVALL